MRRYVRMRCSSDDYSGVVFVGKGMDENGLSEYWTCPICGRFMQEEDIMEE